MEGKYISRRVLKSYFEKNRIPTQEQFAHFISSSVNQNDDGLVKEESAPLLLEFGNNGEQKRAVSFLDSFESTQVKWHLDLSPKQQIAGSEINQDGFSISDGNEVSRLFISQQTKRIGIGTIQPESQLHLATVSGDNSMHFESQKNNLSLTLGQIGANNQGSLLMHGSDVGKKVFLRASKGSFYIDSTDGEYRFNNDNFSEKGAVLRLFEKTSIPEDSGSVILNSEGDSYFKNRVGIGAIAPEVALDVKGVVRADQLQVSYNHSLLTKKDWMKGGILMSQSSDLLFLGLKDEGSNKQAAVLGWGDNESDKLHLKYIDHNTPATDNGFDVITLNGDGHVGMTNPDPQYPLDMHLDTSNDSWRKFTISLETFWDGNNKHATIGAGAHGVMLKHPYVSWQNDRATIRVGRFGGTESGHYFDVGLINTGKFRISPNASPTVGIFTDTLGRIGLNSPDPQYPLDMRLDSSTHGWRRFTVSLQSFWDRYTNHATIGAGTEGIMLVHPHVPWQDNRATIRYGLLPGTSNFFDVGLISTGKFRISPNASATVGIFTDHTGKTGINNNNPGQALDVDGHIRSNRALLIENTGSSGHVSSFDTTSHEAPYVNWMHKGLRYFYLMAGGIGTRGRIRFAAERGSTFGFVGGNVGIGMENPQRPLHVMTQPGSGNRYAIRIEHPSLPSNSWDIGIDNDSNGVDIDLLFGYRGRYIAAIDEDGTYQKGSDRALKKNIKEVSPVIDKVLQLKPSTYQYKASDKKRTKIGMIAQEVVEYFPELVSKKEFYSLDYSGFGVIAIKAIQEQQQMIEKLQEEVENLKKIIK